MPDSPAAPASLAPAVAEERDVPRPDSVNRGTAAILLAQVVALVLTFLAHILVAQHPQVQRNPGAYSDYQIVLSIVLMLNHLVHYGLPSAVGKWVAEDRAYAGYFLSKGWKLQLVFAGSLLVFALLLAPFILYTVLDQPDYWLPYLVAISSVPAYAYFNQRASVMGGLQLFRAESKIYMAYAVVRFVGIFLALGIGAGPKPYAGWEGVLRTMFTAALFAPTLAALVGFALAWRATQFRLGYREDPDMARTIIRFVLPNMLIVGLLQLLMRFDLWSVKEFSGPARTLLGLDLAALYPAVPNLAWPDYYAGGNTIANLFFTLGASLYATTYPTIAAMRAQGRDDAARAILTNSMRALVVVGCPAVALAAGLGPAILGLLYPADYAQMGPAFAILVAATVLQTVYMNLIVAVVAGGEQRKVWRNLLAMVVPGILYNVAFAWLLNRAGVAGGSMLAAACAALATALTGVIGLGWVARRQFGGLLDATVLGKAVLAAALTGGLLRVIATREGLAFLEELGLAVLPVAVLALVPYVILILILGVFTPDELALFRRKLAKLRRRTKGQLPSP